MSSGHAGELRLLYLPDELLLLIIDNLRAIRLHQPQSHAFKNRHQEMARQFENRLRRTALHALCLTSKKLNRLAVPALYNAITGSTTWYGLTPLRLFWKAFTENEHSRNHLEYVENLFSDCLGNELGCDVENCRRTEEADYLGKFWLVNHLVETSIFSTHDPNLSKHIQ